MKQLIKNMAAMIVQSELGFGTVEAKEAMERGSNNFFGISRRLVGAGRFERPTPCAQVVKTTSHGVAPNCTDVV
jgi:hypothetical protein